MDLESDTSTMESMGDNDLSGPNAVNRSLKFETNGSGIEHQFNYNGTMYPEPVAGTTADHVSDEQADELDSRNHDTSDNMYLQSKGKDIAENIQRTNSGSSPTNSSPGGTKGRGLRKWRRIRRDAPREGSPVTDLSKILKRGLPSSADVGKPLGGSTDAKKKSEEGSVSSTIALINSPRGPEKFSIPGPSVLPYAASFTAGTDSDNSEDRSSKSSTAASGPKRRYDIPRSSVIRDKNRTKNLTGRSMNTSNQRSQQSKGKVDASKKQRGEWVSAEKENSFSSVDSDSRSYNSVFMRGMPLVPNFEGQQIDTMNGDDEHSFSSVAGEQHSDAADVSESGRDADDFIQDDARSSVVKENKSHSDEHSKEWDPLVDTFFRLQCAQESLEREVQKFSDIGKVLSTFCDDSNKAAQFSPFPAADSCESEGSGSIPELFKAEVTNSTANVKTLEKQLEDSRVMLQERELKIIELEDAIDSSKSRQADSRSTIELEQKRCQDTETELEDLFKKRVEAEVEYLTMTEKIDHLRIVAEDQVKLLAVQETVAKEQTEILKTIGEFGGRVKGQAEELENYSSEFSRAEDFSKIQRKIFKYSSCLFLQFFLLAPALWHFFSYSSPDSGVVIPT